MLQHEKAVVHIFPIILSSCPINNSWRMCLQEFAILAWPTNAIKLSKKLGTGMANERSSVRRKPPQGKNITQTLLGCQPCQMLSINAHSKKYAIQKNKFELHGPWWASKEPRVPRETKVDVAKCHTCHADVTTPATQKGRGATAPKRATRASPVP